MTKLDKIIELLDSGAKVNTPDSYGSLPLSVAVEYRKPKTVEFLLKRGADPNKKNSEALWYAINNDHNDMLQMLIDAGVNVNVKDFKGFPLISRLESVSKIGLLLKNGVDPNTMVGNSPYVFYLISRRQYALIQIILDKGLNVNITDTATGYNAIMTAAEYNLDDIVETFIKAGTDVNAVNKEGKTALDIAIARDNVKTVEKLIKAGVKVDINTFRRFLEVGKKTKFFDMILSGMSKDSLNSKDPEGKPLLFDIINSMDRLASFDILKAFLDKGANINVVDAKGFNALFLPNVAKSPQLLELLLTKGIDTTIQDPDGLTALYYFIRNGGPVENLKGFIDAGFDVNHRNKRGMTPLLFAVNAGMTQYIDPLIALGADINAAMDNGMNGIHVAIMSPVPSTKSIEVLKNLVQKGFDYNKKSANGTTPLVLAILKARAKPQENTQVVLYLLSLPDIDIRSPQPDSNMSPAELAALGAQVDILDAILAKGFDINEKLSNGLSLLENAQRQEFDSIINDFILSEYDTDTSGLWRGYTQSDLVKFDTIFDTTRVGGRIPAANVSLCPVCNEFVFRGEACKYMYHNCTLSGHLYHKKLYDMFKTPEGIIWWCIVCGRICNGHTHYRVAHHSVKPPLEIPGAGADLYSDDCTGAEKGGGLKEKIKRFIRLRQVSKELNAQVGTITIYKAFRKQVEANWDGPLYVSDQQALQQMAAKKYNLPPTNFPVNAARFASNAPEKPNWNARNFPDVARTAEEAAGFEPPKIIKGRNHGGSQNDNVDVIQFHHVRKNGSVNDHAGRYISAEYLEMWLGSMNSSFKTDKFGFCWDYGQGCTARLFPDEVQPFIDADTYNEYRRKFNWKFAEGQGGGGNNGKFDIFTEAEDALCLLPSQVRKGGKRSFMKTRKHFPKIKKSRKQKKCLK